MRIARLFDGRDATGDLVFTPDHPRVEDPVQRALIAGFLRSGKVVVRVPGLDVDRLDPARPEVVPLSTLTDGIWIWGAALRYYVEVHGIAPEPDFIAHMAACGYQADTPAESAWREALAVLRDS
ncbi:hypothetical protein [Nocardia sp. NRRL S-836]|uniref:hypothetical protein n=1 Tax=Nocardia sp. NRRL S-836 TaxID=1519492 RepID=UPI0006B00074|nr:hypothetical protein [Nocardia sp. NRRL S-836]